MPCPTCSRETRRVAENLSWCPNCGALCPDHEGAEAPALLRELLVALKGLLAVIHDSDRRERPSSMRLLAIVSGKPEFKALDAARDAVARAEGAPAS